MKERNRFLEIDGLNIETETHEWFNDKICTSQAQRESLNGNGSLKHIYCFIVRNKSNGEYERVVFDNKAKEVIYSSTSLEDIGFYIDKLKVVKRFGL